MLLLRCEVNLIVENFAAKALLGVTAYQKTISRMPSMLLKRITTGSPSHYQLDSENWRSIWVAEQLGETLSGRTELFGKAVLVYKLARQDWEKLPSQVNS